LELYATEQADQLLQELWRQPNYFQHSPFVSIRSVRLNFYLKEIITQENDDQPHSMMTTSKHQLFAA